MLRFGAKPLQLAACGALLLGTVIVTGCASTPNRIPSAGQKTAMSRPRIDLCGEWGFVPDVGEQRREAWLCEHPG